MIEVLTIKTASDPNKCKKSESQKFPSSFPPKFLIVHSHQNKNKAFYYDNRKKYYRMLCGSVNELSSLWGKLFLYILNIFYFGGMNAVLGGFSLPFYVCSLVRKAWQKIDAGVVEKLLEQEEKSDSVCIF